jgi:hypothetical protein
LSFLSEAGVASIPLPIKCHRDVYCQAGNIAGLFLRQTLVYMGICAEFYGCGFKGGAVIVSLLSGGFLARGFQKNDCLAKNRVLEAS